MLKRYNSKTRDHKVQNYRRSTGPQSTELQKEIICYQKLPYLFPILRSFPSRVRIFTNSRKDIKPFRFLNFWTKHETFKDLIQENWNAEFCGNPFIVFQHKLKKVKRALVKWSKDT
uniref:Putative ovule protein n=1 Tax=Solanum chacoense TaxID=4108 RepID=A0A0V0H262_SOLCH